MRGERIAGPVCHLHHYCDLCSCWVQNIGSHFVVHHPDVLRFRSTVILAENSEGDQRWRFE